MEFPIRIDDDSSLSSNSAGRAMILYNYIFRYLYLNQKDIPATYRGLFKDYTPNPERIEITYRYIREIIHWMHKVGNKEGLELSRLKHKSPTYNYTSGGYKKYNPSNSVEISNVGDFYSLKDIHSTMFGMKNFDYNRERVLGGSSGRGYYYGEWANESNQNFLRGIENWNYYIKSAGVSHMMDRSRRNWPFGDFKIKYYTHPRKRDEVIEYVDDASYVLREVDGNPGDYDEEDFEELVNDYEVEYEKFISLFKSGIAKHLLKSSALVSLNGLEGYRNLKIRTSEYYEVFKEGVWKSFMENIASVKDYDRIVIIPSLNFGYFHKKLLGGILFIPSGARYLDTQILSIDSLGGWNGVKYLPKDTGSYLGELQHELTECWNKVVGSRNRNPFKTWMNNITNVDGDIEKYSILEIRLERNRDLGFLNW